MHISNPSWLRYALSFFVISIIIVFCTTGSHTWPFELPKLQVLGTKNLGSAGFALVDGVLAKDRGHEFVF